MRFFLILQIFLQFFEPIEQGSQMMTIFMNQMMLKFCTLQKKRTLAIFVMSSMEEYQIDLFLLKRGQVLSYRHPKLF